MLPSAAILVDAFSVIYIPQSCAWSNITATPLFRTLVYSMSYLAKFYWLQGSRAVTIKDHQFCLLSTHSSPARTASWLGPRTCYQGRVISYGRLRRASTSTLSGCWWHASCFPPRPAEFMSPGLVAKLFTLSSPSLPQSPR